MEDNYEWLEVIEAPQKHRCRVMDENAPAEEGWEHVHTCEYVMSSGQVEYISYIFRRKKKEV